MSMLSCCAVTATEAATVVLQSECLVAFPAKLLPWLQEEALQPPFASPPPPMTVDSTTCQCEPKIAFTKDEQRIT